MPKNIMKGNYISNMNMLMEKKMEKVKNMNQINMKVNI